MVRFLAFALFVSSATAAEIPGFRKGPYFDEQVREAWIADGSRVHFSAPNKFDPKKPTELLIFATPNGNTLEQTLGCASSPLAPRAEEKEDRSRSERTTLDWHFDIQHIAAQTRQYRSLKPDANVVLACVDTEVLAWPAWKKARNDGPAAIRTIVETLRKWIPGDSITLTLACHSGGGSFLFGYIDGGETIPDDIERFVFLDANYGYTDADKHGEKLLKWLNSKPSHRLSVIAYDDRKIEINGKLVVGPDGGTFRATERMRTRFTKDVEWKETTSGDLTTRTALNCQVQFLVHANPKNAILHTVLVGDMNGLLHGMTFEDQKPKWGAFGSPRTYTKFVQPAPGIPPRPKDAVGGAKFYKTILKMPRAEREEAIAVEILKGNIPDFLRTFAKIELKSKTHTGVVEVMPDYLAVGSDSDFVRVPMNPMTACRIAEAFGCSLPTKKIADDVYTFAPVKLEPKPLTEDRDSAAAFLKHHGIIEEQRKGQKLGDVVAGIKKDVVISNRLDEKPNKVAIYGWHKLDGKPIQPVNVSHVDWYVDYSHGIRLMKRTMLVDGKPKDVRNVLASPELSGLLSDEGPIKRFGY